MIRPHSRAGSQPIQIPLDRRFPLFQLPVFPRHPVPQDIRPPKGSRRLTAGSHAIPQPEILKPFQNKEKTRAFLLRKTTELRKILPPAPTCFESAHEIGTTSTPSQRQPEMCSYEHFSAPEAISPPGNPNPSIRNLQSPPKKVPVPPAISARAPRHSLPSPTNPDLRTLIQILPCLSITSGDSSLVAPTGYRQSRCYE